MADSEIKRDSSASTSRPTTIRRPVRENAKIVRGALVSDVSKEVTNALKEIEKQAEDCEKTAKKLKDKEELLAEQEIKLAKLEAQLLIERATADRQKKTFQEETDALVKEKDLMEKERKITTSFNTEDISAYLNRVIKDFNDSKESDSDIATYVINNMDVDLKVRLCGDEAGKALKLTAPSIAETSEDSLSSIKISIQAVPK